MTSTMFLVTTILLVTMALLHLAAWHVVRAAVRRVPGLLPRIAGSHLWARGEPWRARFSDRHPRLAAAIVARLTPTAFTGLPLLLIIVAALYALALLGGLVDLIHSHHGTVSLDQAADDAFKPYRTPWMLKAALWVTAMGAGPCLAAMLLVTTALLWSGTRSRFIAPLWIAFLGAQATTWTTKYIVARPRPVFLPDITEWNPSFPSGHATAVTALIGMLGYIVAASVPGLRARFEAGFWATAVVALICFSRIFLGVHFLTDVAAGILVGVFWVLVGYTVGALQQRRGG